MDLFWAFALLPFISAGAGAYFGGYLRKKGENLATHEDIDKLREQVGVVTTTTKEIEARISNEVWDRQKRWEMTREVLFSAIKGLAEMDDALTGMRALLAPELQALRKPDNAQWLGAVHEKHEKYLQATRGFDHALLLVAAICSDEIRKAFQNFRLSADKLAMEIINNNSADKQLMDELSLAIFGARAAVRKELGITGPSLSLLFK